MPTVSTLPSLNEFRDTPRTQHRQKERILVIEEDPEANPNLRRILELNNFEAESCSSIAELQAYPDLASVSCLLLDRNFPDGKAELLLSEIREKAPRAAVFVVTAFADLDSAVAAVRYGVKDDVSKPRNPDALLSAFHRVAQEPQTQEKLQQSERLAAIGRMVSSVSHETRNELHVLKTGLDLLASEVAEPKAQEWIKHLRVSRSRLQRLLDDLREFAGPLELRCSLCPLALPWRCAWSQLEEHWKDRRAELHEDQQCSSIKCTVDSFRLEQVFRNLFENSLQACSDPVRIDISCTEAVLFGERAVRIVVHDNGPGLSQEEKEHVFEPFFTTRHRGTGLGMAIVQRIVEAHDGTIQVGDSTQGGQFVIRLPLRTWETGRATAREEEPVGQPKDSSGSWDRKQ